MTADDAVENTRRFTMPYSKDYPSGLTPDERHRELATILGQGLLRFFGSGALEAESHSQIAPGEETETVQKYC